MVGDVVAGGIDERDEFVRLTQLLAREMMRMRFGGRSHPIALSRGSIALVSGSYGWKARLWCAVAGSHLVLEIVGRHLFEDLGPFVAGDSGQILIGDTALLRRLVQLARAFEHLLGDIDRRLGAQRDRDRVARARVDLQT